MFVFSTAIDARLRLTAYYYFAEEADPLPSASSGKTVIETAAPNNIQAVIKNCPFFVVTNNDTVSFQNVTVGSVTDGRTT